MRFLFFKIKFAPVDNYFLLLSFASIVTLKKDSYVPVIQKASTYGSKNRFQCGEIDLFHLYSNTLANR